MARVTVEDCLNHVGNRFDLVIMAAKRARQLTAGAISVLPRENDKNTVLALREIAAGVLDLEKLMQEEEKLLIHEPEEEMLLVPEETEILDRMMVADEDEDEEEDLDDEEDSLDDVDDELAADLMKMSGLDDLDDLDPDAETRALMAEEIRIPGVDEERFSGLDVANDLLIDEEDG